MVPIEDTEWALAQEFRGPQKLEKTEKKILS